MKYRGIVYDVGLRFVTGHPYSVEPFDPALVRYDMNAIAGEMQANAVRIEGEETERLVIASRIAHEAGLTVFFNPWKMNVAVDELPAYFRETARAAETLRTEGLDIVFVCGCEMTLFNQGIFPGETVMERVAWLGTQSEHGASAEATHEMSKKSEQLNDVFRSVASAVRDVYSGKMTYSAGSWEKVDWSRFDITGVDYYRYDESAEEYVAGLERPGLTSRSWSWRLAAAVMWGRQQKARGDSCCWKVRTLTAPESLQETLFLCAVNKSRRIMWKSNWGCLKTQELKACSSMFSLSRPTVWAKAPRIWT
ncbi:hypothetical protein [Dickeya dadantii]|uniref:hypothetical protein n=1 Tax=Dickeya dadantii TaxID=204038 RepID=UPI001C0BFED1|nr:hypothetical protein [Dickeya dadantii]QWT40334.1 hypothetical protein KNV89_18675 [Dickeya dadantii]